MKLAREDVVAAITSIDVSKRTADEVAVMVPAKPDGTLPEGVTPRLCILVGDRLAVYGIPIALLAALRDTLNRLVPVDPTPAPAPADVTKH